MAEYLLPSLPALAIWWTVQIAFDIFRVRTRERFGLDWLGLEQWLVVTLIALPLVFLFGWPQGDQLPIAMFVFFWLMGTSMLLTPVLRVGYRHFE